MATNVFQKMLLIVSLIFICLTNVTEQQTSAARTSEDYSIDLDIFGINPNVTIVPSKYMSGLFPSIHPQCTVRNIGRSSVLAKLKYGTAYGWIGNVVSIVIQPNINQVMDNYNRVYYATGVEITNDQSTRAIVHVSCGSRSINNNPWPDYDKNKILRGAFELGVKYIPDVSNGLGTLISTFWPENKPNVWEQLYQEVKTLLDTTTQQTIYVILNGDIKYLRQRMVDLGNLIKGNDINAVNNNYMNIVQDLIGLEQKFEFKNTSTTDYFMINFYILPLYSTVITMKMHFYALGIARPQLFQLNQTQVNLVKQYASNCLYGNNSTGAINYVRNMYQDVVEELYRTAYTGGLFNVMMNARSHIILHGLQLIPVWEQAYKNPNSSSNPYINVVAYSNLFGRASAYITHYATLPNVPSPLTPSLKADGTRRKLASIDVFIWRIYGNGPARIGGLRLNFEGPRVIVLGTETSEVQKLDLTGLTITKLRAYGSGAIDSLVFTLSDGTSRSFGLADSNVYADFELKDHYIIGMVLSSDIPQLNGQAANIAVSYLQKPVTKPVA